MGPAVGGMTKRCAGAARYEDGEHPNGESRAPRLLPGYDSQTRRMEMGAFFLLGSVALTLVVLAAGNAVRFSENRDGIAAALSSGGVVVTSRSSAEETNHVLTNVTVIPTLGRGTPVSASQPVGHQS